MLSMFSGWLRHFEGFIQIYWLPLQFVFWKTIEQVRMNKYKILRKSKIKTPKIQKSIVSFERKPH